MSKLLSLAAAVGLIKDGDTVALGGNTIQRSPAAFAREMARRKKRNIELVKTAGAYDVDLLALAGCLSAVHAGYIGFENMGLAPNYRKAVEGGQTQAKEHACYTVIAGLRAAAYGIPFMPVAGFLGSELLEVRDFKLVKDPFTGQEVVAVQKLQPDWAVIHVHEADVEGNGRILGSQFEDALMTRAAKGVILTAERIVDKSQFQKHPESVAIPGFLVNAVVELPGGAAPGSCYPLYDANIEAIRSYLAMAPEALEDYLKEVR